jgi:Kef-type K+ transport system membrane component KefB
MSHLLQLLLVLVAIIVCAKLAGALSIRTGFPAVFGELLVGLILGPTLLDLLGFKFFLGTRDVLGQTLKDFAEVGVILLMFVAGLETDLEELKRVGSAAFWSAVGGVILPMVGGALVAHGFGFVWRESIFIGTVLTATSVSISAQTLMELKALKSKEGATILGAAVIDDVLGIIVLSLVVAFSISGAGGSQSSSALPDVLARLMFGGSRFAEIAIVVVLMSIFFAVSIWFGSRFFDRLLHLAARMPASQPLLAMTVAIAMAYSFVAQYVGQVAAITGSYIAGVLVARTPFKRDVDRGIHPLAYSILVPIFLVSIGLEANARPFFSDPSKLLFLSSILLVAVLGKILGCGLAARATGFSLIESLRVGIGMTSRGEVGLIVAGAGLGYGVISQEVFSMVVIVVLVTTMITPLLLRLVFPLTIEGRVIPDAEFYEAVAGMEDRLLSTEVSEALPPAEETHRSGQ